MGTGDIPQAEAPAARLAAQQHADDLALLDVARAAIFSAYSFPDRLLVHPDTRRELWDVLRALGLESGIGYHWDEGPPDDLRVWGVPTRASDLVPPGEFIESYGDEPDEGAVRLTERRRTLISSSENERGSPDGSMSIQ